MEEYCVMCGEIIPEGTHICVHCGELKESGEGRMRKLLPGGLVCKGNNYRVTVEEHQFSINSRKGKKKLSCSLEDVERLYHSNHKLFGKYRLIVSPKSGHNSFCIVYDEQEKATFQSLNEVLEDNCRTLCLSWWKAMTYRGGLRI